MTTQPPEAVKLASEYRETMPADVLHLWARDAVDEMRRLHEEAVDLRVLSSSLLNKNGGLQLAVWTVQNANSALQARVQELEAERDRFRDAHREWSDKTDWVQESSQAHELGKHRADVLRERIVRVQRELDAALEVMGASAKAGAAWAARAHELEAERDHFRGATEMVPEGQKMAAYQQVVAAWNAQADEHNQWDALGEDEKIEWALERCDQFRGAAKMMMMQAAQQALEALEEIEWSNDSQWQSDRAKVAIAALREAITQDAGGAA